MGQITSPVQRQLSAKLPCRPWVIVAVTVQVSTLMLVRKIDTVFVHHGYPHHPNAPASFLTGFALISKSTPERVGGQLPPLAPVATPLTIVGSSIFVY